MERNVSRALDAGWSRGGERAYAHECFATLNKQSSAEVGDAYIVWKFLAQALPSSISFVFQQTRIDARLKLCGAVPKLKIGRLAQQSGTRRRRDGGLNGEF